MTNDRLDELATFRMEDDTPPDARISVPWRDLRDLVRLIPVARAALRYDEDGAVTALLDAVEELRKEEEP